MALLGKGLLLQHRDDGLNYALSSWNLTPALHLSAMVFGIKKDGRMYPFSGEQGFDLERDAGIQTLSP